MACFLPTPFCLSEIDEAFLAPATECARKGMARVPTLSLPRSPQRFCVPGCWHSLPPPVSAGLSSAIS